MGYLAVPIETPEGIKWVAPKPTTIVKKTISRGGGSSGRTQYQVLYKTSYDAATKRYVTRRVEVPKSQFDARAKEGYSVSKEQSQFIAETVQQKADQAQLLNAARNRRMDAKGKSTRSQPPTKNGLSDSAKNLVMIQEFKGATDSSGEGWLRSKGFSDKLRGIEEESIKKLMKEPAPIEYTAFVPYKNPSQAPTYARQSGALHFGSKDYDVDFTYKKPPKGKVDIQLNAGATIYPDFMKGYKKPSFIDKALTAKVPFSTSETGFVAPNTISSDTKRGGISSLFTVMGRKGREASFQMFGTTNPVMNPVRAYTYAQEGLAGGTTKLLIPQKLIGTMGAAANQPFKENKGFNFNIGTTTYKFKEPTKSQQKVWDTQSGIIKASQFTLSKVREKPVDVAAEYYLFKGLGAATSYGVGAFKYGMKVTKIGKGISKGSKLIPKVWRNALGIGGKTALYGGIGGLAASDIYKQPTLGEKIFKGEQLAFQAYAFGKGYKYSDRFAFQRAAKKGVSGYTDKTFQFKPQFLESQKGQFQATLKNRAITPKQARQINYNPLQRKIGVGSPEPQELNPFKPYRVTYQPKSQATLSQFGKSGLKRTDIIGQGEPITRTAKPIKIINKYPFSWDSTAKEWRPYNIKEGYLGTTSHLSEPFKIARTFMGFPKVTTHQRVFNVEKYFTGYNKLTIKKSDGLFFSVKKEIPFYKIGTPMFKDQINSIDKYKGAFRTIDFPKYKKGGQIKPVDTPSKGTFTHETPPSHAKKGLQSFNTPKHIEAVKQGQKKYPLVDFENMYGGRITQNYISYPASKMTPAGMKATLKPKMFIFPDIKTPRTKVKQSTVLFGVEKMFSPVIKVNTKPTTRLVTKQLQDIKQETFPKFKVIPNFQFKQTTRQIPDLKIRQETIITPDIITSPIIDMPPDFGFGWDTPPPPPPPPPIIGFPDFDLGGGMRGRSRGKTKRKKSYGQYSPSLFAIDFNIKTSKEPKFTSGIGIRPIPRMRL